MKESTRLVISLQNAQQSINATRTSKKLKCAEEGNCHKHVTDSLCYLSTMSHFIFEELYNEAKKLYFYELACTEKK
jgi:hypothetical protein